MLLITLKRMKFLMQSKINVRNGDTYPEVNNIGNNQEHESALLLFIPFSLYEKVRAANAVF